MENELIEWKPEWIPIQMGKIRRTTYSLEEVMKILRISRSTAYRLLGMEKFPMIKIGGVYRIPRATFDAWVEGVGPATYLRLGIHNRTMTLQEMMLELGISRATAWKILKDSPFCYVKIGHSYRISRRSFERWLEGGR